MTFFFFFFSQILLVLNRLVIVTLVPSWLLHLLALQLRAMAETVTATANIAKENVRTLQDMLSSRQDSAYEIVKVVSGRSRTTLIASANTLSDRDA